MSSELARELKELFARGAGVHLEESEFNRLALRVFEHQFRHNAPFRAYAESEGRTPETVTRWQDVPLVPTTAFKSFELVAGDPRSAEATFHTSGTTAGELRGSHAVLDLDLYHASLRAGFRQWVLPDGATLEMVQLVPDSEELADSSLSHMAKFVRENLCTPGGTALVDAAGGLDEGRLFQALQESMDRGAGLLLFGTAFSFAATTEALRATGRRFALPAGSRIMETGGFKGRRKEISQERLRDELVEWLGVPRTHVVAEYGMTEMLSQFYDPVLRSGGTRSGVFVGPAWVRTRVLDPERLEPVRDGTPGVLAHFDLANLNSVSAILTEDLGIGREGGFELLGRASPSELRGCSLTFEEIERAQRGSHV